MRVGLALVRIVVTFQKISAVNMGADHLVRGPTLFHPTFQGTQIVNREGTTAAATMLHARHHKEPEKNSCVACGPPMGAGDGLS